jgi:hypothetical protein
VLASDEFVKLLGTMPMDTLAAFPGLVFDHDELDQLVASLP